MKYTVDTNTWETLEFKCNNDSYNCHYDVHPWDSSLVLEYKTDGNICVRKLADFSVVHEYQDRYTNWDNVPETVVLAAPNSEFYVLACNGNNGRPWRVFSSVTGKWTDLPWPTVNTYSRTAFFDASTKQLYYHIRGETNWTIVQLP